MKFICRIWNAFTLYDTSAINGNVFDFEFPMVGRILSSREGMLFDFWNTPIQRDLNHSLKCPAHMPDVGNVICTNSVKDCDVVVTCAHQ